MARRLEGFDWSGSPLGSPSAWPGELKAALGICLHSSVPTAIYWGPELRLLYNDAWMPVAGELHPWAIGRPAAEVWASIWPIVGPQFEHVMQTGKGFSTSDQMLPLQRDGETAETYWDYSFTPIFDSSGRVAGVFNQGLETTARVLAQRAQDFALELRDRLRDLTSGEKDAAAGLSIILERLGRHLGLARVGYSVVEGEVAHVAGSWRKPGMPDVANGKFRLPDFGGPVMAEMLSGRTVSSADVLKDARFSEEAVANLRRFGVRANAIAPIVRNGRAIAFLFMDDDKPRRWSPHETDLARETAERIWVALDRAETMARLRENERRFAAIFGEAGVGLSEVDEKGAFIRINPSMARILGRSVDEASGLTISQVTHPDDLALTDRRLAEAHESGEPYSIEKRYVRPDGSYVWAQTNVTRLLDDKGKVNGFFSVTTDVTERKEQERIRAWLLAELNHRVKNNLATVQALAHQTRATTSSVDEFERVFNARLMALSHAHNLLMRETWTSAPLADLVTATLAPYGSAEPDRIVSGGPDVRLAPTAAVTFSLALHELATNAAKFGALSRAGGRVSVTWNMQDVADRAGIRIAWREADGPPVEAPQRRGFGLRLIERGAPAELGGEAKLEFTPTGVACVFQFPLSQKVMLP